MPAVNIFKEGALLDFRENFFFFAVVFNEPLSFLQRIVEYGDYIDLVAKAAQTDDPVERIQVLNISYG